MVAIRILVLGATGQIGGALTRGNWPPGVLVTGLNRAQADLTDEASLSAAFERHRPDVVINATAWTAVDKAESEEKAAWAVNADGPRLLARLCAAQAVPLIHISTDYVFDGTGTGAYLETDPVNPVSAYGRGKEAGEAAVRAELERHVIVRVAWIYSAGGANFVRTMLRLAGERPELRVVGDQFGTPTAADDVAACLMMVALRITNARKNPVDAASLWGTYHFTAAGSTSWHGLADHIFQILERETGARPKLEAITTADYPTPAQRPANSRLDCTKIEKTFGIRRPDWQDGVERVVMQLLADQVGAGEGR